MPYTGIMNISNERQETIEATQVVFAAHFVAILMALTFVAVYILADPYGMEVLWNAWSWWALIWVSLGIFGLVRSILNRRKHNSPQPEPKDDYWKAVHRNLRT